MWGRLRHLDSMFLSLCLIAKLREVRFEGVPPNLFIDFRHIPSINVILSEFNSVVHFMAVFSGSDRVVTFESDP